MDWNSAKGNAARFSLWPDRNVRGTLRNMSTTILDRLIEPFADCLTTEAAIRITALRADDVIQQRIDELADLANRSALTQEEQSEYDRYLAAFHFVTVLQARARRLLKT